MEGMLTVLLLVAAVAARGLPKTPKPDFVPSPELLDSIFSPPASDKPVEIPVEITPKTDDTVPSEKKDSNVGETKDHTHTFEVDVKIRVGADCDKDRISIQENIELNGNDITTKAGDEKQAKYKKGNVRVTSLSDDRMAFGGDACPQGKVRVWGVCVLPD